MIFVGKISQYIGSVILKISQKNIREISRNSRMIDVGGVGLQQRLHGPGRSQGQPRRRL